MVRFAGRARATSWLQKFNQLVHLPPLNCISTPCITRSYSWLLGDSIRRYAILFARAGQVKAIACECEANCSAPCRAGRRLRDQHARPSSSKKSLVEDTTPAVDMSEYCAKSARDRLCCCQRLVSAPWALVQASSQTKSGMDMRLQRGRAG